MKSSFKLVGVYGSPSQKYENNVIFKGIIEGYLTIDALSALLFGSVVVAAI